MIGHYRRPMGRRDGGGLDEMVIAYDTESVPDADHLPDDGSETPARRDDSDVVAGEAVLRSHPDELRALPDPCTHA